MESGKQVLTISPQATAKERVHAALDELMTGRTYMRPYIIWDAEICTLVELNPFGGDLCIGGIFVPLDKRGQGLGSAILKEIIEVADKHGARLILSAKPFGRDPGLNKTHLKAWYKRHGFELRNASGDMVRQPGGAAPKARPRAKP